MSRLVIPNFKKAVENTKSPAESMEEDDSPKRRFWNDKVAWVEKHLKPLNNLLKKMDDQTKKRVQLVTLPNEPNCTLNNVYERFTSTEFFELYSNKPDFERKCTEKVNMITWLNRLCFEELNKPDADFQVYNVSTNELSEYDSKRRVLVVKENCNNPSRLFNRPGTPAPEQVAEATESADSSNGVSPHDVATQCGITTPKASASH